MNYSAITFDIDWAPDWCIELCADICRSHNTPATFFVTHESLLLEDLAADPLFELGIHPNFLPGSSQGKTSTEVLDFCMDIVPTANAMRTHSLVQSSPLFSQILRNYPNIHTDVSLLLPNHSNLQPVDFHVYESTRQLVRLPYFWEDDCYSYSPKVNWSNLPPYSPGLRIYDFHPVLVALNMAKLEQYKVLLENLASKPLYEATLKDFSSLINIHLGVRTFLEELLKTQPPNGFSLISNISNNYLDKNP